MAGKKKGRRKSTYTRTLKNGKTIRCKMPKKRK